MRALHPLALCGYCHILYFGGGFTVLFKKIKRKANKDHSLGDCRFGACDGNYQNCYTNIQRRRWRQLDSSLLLQFIHLCHLAQPLQKQAPKNLWILFFGVWWHSSLRLFHFLSFHFTYDLSNLAFRLASQFILSFFDVLLWLSYSS